ncbi:hypothetical protein ACLOJK_008314 [Asimina triloba]
MEHLRCSTMLMKWVAAMAATTTTTTGEIEPANLSSTDGDLLRPFASAADEPPDPSIAVQRRQQSHRRRANAHCRETHHARAVVAPIRAIHHDGDDEHIPDPSRPQADVDHSGHTRRVFLARHQQIQLYLAPIVAHFKSKPYHRPSGRRFLLLPVACNHGCTACRRPPETATTLPTLTCSRCRCPDACLPSVRILPLVSIAGCPLCRPSAIAQPRLPMTHPPASACRRRCPRTATASARCPHPPPSSMPSVASNNGPDQAATKYRPPTM